MSGNSKATQKKMRGLILQPRDLQLLRELSVMRIADREQAKVAASFTSTTRVNTRLLTLTNAGLLRRFFLGYSGAKKALYSVSPKGAQVAGVPCRGPRRPHDTMLVADFFVEHQLTINNIYCALKHRTIPVPQIQFQRWLSFHQPLVPQINLIPDGYAEFTTPSGTSACFLEVDLGHESLAIWKEKARRYLQLAVSGEYRKNFHQERFRVLVVTHSERKLHSIRKAVAEVTQKIFWFATLKSVQQNLFAPVWCRPADNKLTPLFEEHP